MANSIIIADLSPTMGRIIKVALKGKYEILGLTSDEEVISNLNKAVCVLISSKFPPHPYELVKNIKEVATKPVPCIMLCGKESPYDESKGSESLVDAFFNHPFKNKDLLDKIDNLVKNSDQLAQQLGSLNEDASGQNDAGDQGGKDSTQPQGQGDPEMGNDDDLNVDDLLNELSGDAGETAKPAEEASGGGLSEDDILSELGLGADGAASADSGGAGTGDMDLDSLLNEIGSDDSATPEPAAPPTEEKDEGQGAIDDILGDLDGLAVSDTPAAPAASGDSGDDGQQNSIDDLLNGLDGISDPAPAPAPADEGQGAIDDILGGLDDSPAAPEVAASAPADEGQGAIDDILGGLDGLGEEDLGDDSAEEDSQDLIDGLFDEIDDGGAQVDALEEPPTGGATPGIDDLVESGSSDNIDATVDDILGQLDGVDDLAAAEVETPPVAEAASEEPEIELKASIDDDSQDHIEDLFDQAQAEEVPVASNDAAPETTSADESAQVQASDIPDDLDLFDQVVSGDLKIEEEAGSPAPATDLIVDALAEEDQETPSSAAMASSNLNDSIDTKDISQTFEVVRNITENEPEISAVDKFVEDGAPADSYDDSQDHIESLFEGAQGSTGSAEQPLISETEFSQLSRIQDDLNRDSLGEEPLSDTQKLLEDMRKKKAELQQRIAKENGDVVEEADTQPELGEVASLHEFSKKEEEYKPEKVFILGTGEIEEAPNVVVPVSLKNQIKDAAEHILRQVSREVIKEIAEKVIRETLDELLEELEENENSGYSAERKHGKLK